MAALIVETVLATGKVALAGRLPFGFYPAIAKLGVVVAVPANVHICSGGMVVVGIEHVVITVRMLASLVLESVVVNVQIRVLGAVNSLAGVTAVETYEREQRSLTGATVKSIVLHITGCILS